MRDFAGQSVAGEASEEAEHSPLSFLSGYMQLRGGPRLLVGCAVQMCQFLC